MKRTAKAFLQSLDDAPLRRLGIYGEYVAKVGPQRFLDAEIDVDNSDIDDVKALLEHLAELAEQQAAAPGVMLRDTIIDSVSTADKVPEQYTPCASLPAEPPKFPTGLPALDALTGGGYGMTVVAGAPKVGKSLVAVCAAVEAARRGWEVVYFNCELTQYEMLTRLKRYTRGDMGPLKKNLLIVDPTSGFQPLDAAKIVRNRIDPVRAEQDRVLIIIDSINRIANLSGTGSRADGYWRTMEAWSEWLRNAAKSSEGNVASMIISELNGQDHIKGRNLEYAANLVVRMKATEGDIVEIDVPYARGSRGGDCGFHERVWQEARFKFVDFGETEH